MDGAYAQDERPGGVHPVRPPPGEAAVVDRLRSARRDRGAVLLEGAHALKHALRFGADIEVVATPDPAALETLLSAVAPDVAAEVSHRAVHLGARAWERAVGRPLPSPAIAVARRPTATAADVLSTSGVVVVLEDPRHLGNLGAVVRVAAAAAAGGVLVVGEADPWHPIAVRGAAGLQFALPVARTDTLADTDRQLVALDGQGEPLAPGSIPPDAALIVGTERGGLSEALLRRAALRVAIPMRDGVASLNLATAVAVALYAR